MTNANAAITARIVKLVAEGVSVVDACRQVLGPELTDSMIDRLYRQLRAN